MGRNIEYIKANIVIMWRYLSEYKINLYNILLSFGFVLVINISVAFIISSNFGNTIRWEFKDFLLLSAFSGIMWGVSGIFRWTNSLRYNIVSGKLNLMLMRPIRIPVKYYFHSLSGGGFVFFLISLFSLFFFILYFNIVFVNVLSGIFIFILILFSFVLLMFAIDSFNLIHLGLGSQFLIPIQDANNLLTAYPSQFFEKSNIFFILNFVPMFFVSSLLIPLIRGRNVINFQFQIILLTLLTFLFLIILLANWHWGLKRYEAFG